MRYHRKLHQQLDKIARKGLDFENAIASIFGIFIGEF